MPDGSAASSVFNATDRTSGSVIFIYDRMGITGAGSQGRHSWTDQQIWLPGVSVSVLHRCGSLLLSFRTCCLGILGLEGAINCILAWTSHQRTTSEKRTKTLLPKCPLFGGSTVYYYLFLNFLERLLCPRNVLKFVVHYSSLQIYLLHLCNIACTY